LLGNAVKSSIQGTRLKIKAAIAKAQTKANIAAVTNAPERTAMEEAAERASKMEAPRVDLGEDPFSSCYAAAPVPLRRTPEKEAPRVDLGEGEAARSVKSLAQCFGPPAATRLTIGCDDAEETGAPAPERVVERAGARKSSRTRGLTDEDPFASCPGASPAQAAGPLQRALTQQTIAGDSDDEDGNDPASGGDAAEDPDAFVSFVVTSTAGRASDYASFASPPVSLTRPKPGE